jgi:hypothetical protein
MKAALTATATAMMANDANNLVVITSWQAHSYLLICCPLSYEEASIKKAVHLSLVYFMDLLYTILHFFNYRVPLMACWTIDFCHCTQCLGCVIVLTIKRLHTFKNWRSTIKSNTALALIDSPVAFLLLEFYQFFSFIWSCGWTACWPAVSIVIQCPIFFFCFNFQF